MFIRTVLLLAAIESVRSQCTNNVTGYTLVDSQLNTNIGPMPAVLDYAALPTTSLNVRADVESCTTGSTKSALMSYSLSSSKVVCDSLAPFSMYGDVKSATTNTTSYKAFTLPLGKNQTIRATPFTKPKCIGTAGISDEVTFDVVNTAACPGEVLSFVLWDASANQVPLFQINDQQIICSNITSYSIEARVVPCIGGKVGSVKMNIITFKGTNEVFISQKRSGYFLYGNYNQTVYGSGTPLPNKRFTLTATPYSGLGGTGVAGPSKSINFKVSCKPLAV